VNVNNHRENQTFRRDVTEEEGRGKKEDRQKDGKNRLRKEARWPKLE